MKSRSPAWPPPCTTREHETAPRDRRPPGHHPARGARAAVTEVQSTGTELTFNGGPQLDFYLSAYTTYDASIGVTTVHDGWLVLELVGGRGESQPGEPTWCGSLMGGWNHRAVGSAAQRQGLTVDLRALAGATLSVQTGGWFVLPIPGLAGAGELVATGWLNPGLGVSAGLMAGADLATLGTPRPMARASLGLTF